MGRTEISVLEMTLVNKQKWQMGGAVQLSSSGYILRIPPGSKSLLFPYCSLHGFPCLYNKDSMNSVLLAIVAYQTTPKSCSTHNSVGQDVGHDPMGMTCFCSPLICVWGCCHKSGVLTGTAQAGSAGTVSQTTYTGSRERGPEVTDTIAEAARFLLTGSGWPEDT